MGSNSEKAPEVKRFGMALIILITLIIPITPIFLARRLLTNRGLRGGA